MTSGRTQPGSRPGSSPGSRPGSEPGTPDDLVTAEGRPRSPVPRGVIAVVTVSLLALLVLQCVGIARYASLPDPLPRHYGAGGQVDAWEARTPFAAFGVLWIGIAMLLGFGVLIRYLDRIPQRYGSGPALGTTYVRSTFATRWTLALITLPLAGMFVHLHLAVWAGATRLNMWVEIAALVAVSVAAIGWQLGYVGRDERADGTGSGVVP